MTFTRKRKLVYYAAGALGFLIALLCVVGACCRSSNDGGGARSLPPPAKAWAAVLDRTGETTGLKNFHQVSNDLYRGAQPTARGIRYLKKLGVRTIVNLRTFHSDTDEIGDTDIAYVHIRMQAWREEDEDTVRFLKIVTDTAKTPVFVHCQHGADRTGLMCAVYRVAVQGWTKDEAVREMKEGGFGYHAVWKNLIKYIRELDVEKIKRDAGMKKALREKSALPRPAAARRIAA